MHFDLGKLYYQKSKWLNYVLVEELVEPPDTHVWAPLNVLAEAAHNDYILNTDLRSMLAVFDWDSLCPETVSPELASGGELLSHFLYNKETVSFGQKFLSLQDLENWTLDEYGIRAVNPEQEIETLIFEISCKHREVSNWIQPLVRAKTKGAVVLFTRNNNGTNEYLLTVDEEIGISGRKALMPTYLAYPNEQVDTSLSDFGKVKYEFTQSDEGGRFINRESVFRINEVEPNVSTKENQFWVSAHELKRLLTVSNLPTIQLRNICSLLIDELNPNSSNSTISTLIA